MINNIPRTMLFIKSAYSFNADVIKLYVRNFSRSLVIVNMNKNTLKGLTNEKGEFVKKESTFRQQITGMVAFCILKESSGYIRPTDNFGLGSTGGVTGQ